VLETESGTNDPVSINLTLVLTALLVSGSASPWSLGFGIVLQLLLGAIFGYGGGWLLVWFLRRVRLEGAGLYPVLAVAGAFFVYSASNLLGGNGFLAIYLAGLLLGNWRVSPSAKHQLRHGCPRLGSTNRDVFDSRSPRVS
jgi:potassium/hydrogen antiporter